MEKESVDRSLITEAASLLLYYSTRSYNPFYFSSGGCHAEQQTNTV